ncbi:MAG TPA: class I SAM-dependent methyltransferase [Dehalococcoidia bacterium]|nr:class I SAM-dependent methyltransferase [Dehalococcoidia bacterium]
MSTNQPGTLAQQMFGSRAPVYAASPVHVSDDSLEAMVRLAAPGPYAWTVDLGCGAGFTAFAMTQCSQRVVASDLTRPMLGETRRIGQERQLSNLMLSHNAAEHLPFASGSLDLVTCRVAGHHFADFELALDEIHRVLKIGGSLLMADTVAPEDDAVAAWLNDVELRRDFSHVKDRKVSVIEDLLSARDLEIVAREDRRVNLQFNNWVARTATPEPEVTNLRRDFLAGSSAVKQAFEIEPAAGGDINFSWPCWIFRAVKL